MSKNLLNDFFNAVPKTDAPENAPSVEFRPNPKRGQNGVFDALIRFLPNPVDPVNKSIITKFSCYLTHPRTGEKREVDCPSSRGERSILQDTFFNLRGSANPILKENASQFSRKQRYTTLIQVLQCNSQPQLNGKILVWRFGFKVYEKLQAEQNPPIGEPKNPFNLLTGRPFLVRVKEVSGYPNYDSCQFFDMDIAQSGFQIQVPNAQGQLVTQVVTPQTVATPEGQQAVFDYLQKNAPDVTPYEFKPWTDADIQFVNECVQIYSNPELSAQAANQRAFAGGTPVAPAAQTPMGLNIGYGAPAQAAPAPVAPQMPAAGVQAPPVMGVNPAGGIQMPTAAPAPQAMTPNPQFTDKLPEGLDSVLNGGHPSTPQPAAPVMGLNLGDVLAGQFA